MGCARKRGGKSEVLFYYYIPSGYYAEITTYVHNSIPLYLRKRFTNRYTYSKIEKKNDSSFLNLTVVHFAIIIYCRFGIIDPIVHVMAVITYLFADLIPGPRVGIKRRFVRLLFPPGLLVKLTPSFSRLFLLN